MNSSLSTLALAIATLMPMVVTAKASSTRDTVIVRDTVNRKVCIGSPLTIELVHLQEIEFASEYDSRGQSIPITYLFEIHQYYVRDIQDTCHLVPRFDIEEIKRNQIAPPTLVDTVQKKSLTSASDELIFAPVLLNRNAYQERWRERPVETLATCTQVRGANSFPEKSGTDKLEEFLCDRCSQRLTMHLF